MKGIFIIAALAFAIFADILAQDCQDKDDGVLIKNPDDCSKYVECRGKQSKERKCITDTLFDPEKNSCQPPNKVTSCEKIPTTINDPCPETDGYVRKDYPSGNPKKYEFFVLCKDKQFKGYRRDVMKGDILRRDQRYFKDCPSAGQYRVLYVQHQEYYFLCINGIHTRTKRITDAIRDTIMRPEQLPKPIKIEDFKAKIEKVKTEKVKTKKVKTEEVKSAEKVKTEAAKSAEKVRTEAVKSAEKVKTAEVKSAEKVKMEEVKSAEKVKTEAEKTAEKIKTEEVKSAEEVKTDAAKSAEKVKTEAAKSAEKVIAEEVKSAEKVKSEEKVKTEVKSEEKEKTEEP